VDNGWSNKHPFRQSIKDLAIHEPACKRSVCIGLFTHTGRLSMAWKRLGWSLLSPTCLGGYRIFGRSMHRTLMLEVVGIGGHPGADASHCSIPHLKPDKQLLINSQAVYRPSLVENSRVTMRRVEQ